MVAEAPRKTRKKRKTGSVKSAMTPPGPTPAGAVPLKNARHEQFVSLMATGKSPAEAYIAAGFSKTGAAGAAARLLQNVAVKTRLQQIQSLIENATVSRACIDREWVLDLLRRNALAAFAEADRSAVNRAAELLGREIGMFIDRHDHTMKWDGNPASLTEAQQATLIAQLEALVFQGDQAEIAQARREALQLGPGVVDVTGEAVQ